jgi:hypothetical protein
MAMALDTYANFKTAIADQLVRTDLTLQIVDCITLFEAEASNELFRNRRIETTTILVPSNPAAVNVTGAANNGSGLIRLTVSSTSTFTTGQEASVASVGGTTEANGTWLVTVISGTTMDLQGSTFTNTYTSGGTAQAPQGRATLPTDFIGWRRLTWTGNPKRELDYVHPSIFTTEFPTFPAIVAVDLPRSFTIEGGYIKIIPIDGTPLEFDYFGSTPALSSSLNWLFTNRVDAYWNGVLEQIYRYSKDDDQATIYQQAKGAIFDQIKKQQFREAGALAIRVQGSSYGATP